MKHLALTCIAYFTFGIGTTVQMLGLQAGLGSYTTIIIFISCIIFFTIVVFTSLEKVKQVLLKEDKEKEPGTEAL